MLAFVGDANFDAAFNSSDLVKVFQAGNYEKDVLATWAEGDWNGDNRFNSSDLVAAFQLGRYEKDEPYLGHFDVLREAYVSLNEGRDTLGKFIREGESAIENGLYALFESGAIYWAASTGAYEIHGAIWEKYASLGLENSLLGYPVTGESAAPDGVGRFNHFQGGSIYWHPDTGAHEVHGAIRDQWASLGRELSALGYPVTDELVASDGVGRYSQFQGGLIIWSAETGAYEVHGAILEKWGSLGWEQSFLGYPLTNELTTPDGVGRFNHFQGGSIYWHPDSGAHEVHGAIRDQWASLGWEFAALGYPITDELVTSDGVGRYSQFQGGLIIWSADTGAYEVRGAILEKWGSLGWEQSFLGYPLTNELTAPDGAGRFNHFQGGSIYWHPDTGAHEVHGAIRDHWGQIGWETSLGYPLTDETAAPDGLGRYNHFQHGSIYWHPNTGAHEVHGAIRDYWASLGWELSKFGYPLTDERTTCDGDGRFNVFEGGSIYWYPSTGAYEVLGSKQIFVDFNGATLEERQRALTSLPGWDRTADSLAGDSFVDGFNRLQNEFGGFEKFNFLDLNGDGHINWADGNLAAEEIMTRVRGHYCAFDVQVARVDNSDHAIRLMQNNGVTGDMLVFAWAWPGDPIVAGGQAPQDANNSQDNVGESGGSISVARLVVDSRGLSGEAARDSYYSFMANFISHEAGHSFGLIHIDMTKAASSQDVDMMTPLLDGVQLSFRDVNLAVDGDVTQNPYQYLLTTLGYRQHQFELAPANSAARTGNIATVSRIPNSMETWWIGSSGSVEAAYFYDSASWNRYQLAPDGSASTGGDIAAVSRIPESMEVWWIGANGSVQAAHWYEGATWQRYELAPAGSAALGGSIDVVSRAPGTMELWWIGANGSVQGAYWYEGANWQRYELAPTGSASTDGDLTVASRRSGTMELWWIGANGSIQAAYWYEGGTWQRYELAPTGSASLDGGLASVSRIPNSMELWWVGGNGSVQAAYWYEGSNWQRYELTGAGSASLNGGIAVTSRIPNSMEVWWVGTNGEIRDALWYEGSTWQVFDLARGNSASTTGSIAAVSRIAGSMEVFWIGSNGQVRDAYWYENDRWRGV